MSKVEKLVKTKEHYWKLRELCSKGKHKLRDNAFGMTWCVVCGQHSTKSCGVPLKEEDKIITNKLID
jgi:hypothetical protein